MDARAQCKRLSESISLDGTLDWEAVAEALSRPQDQELLARLRSLAATTMSSRGVDPSAPPAPAPVEDSTHSQLAVGDLLADRYQIDAFLDRGGMGEVYRATDQLLSVPVALKVIRPEIASNPASLRRFKQEALLARSVSHPSVCRIYDLGWDGATSVAYLTMEFLPGRTLRTRVLTDGPVTTDEALPLVKQLGEGLDAAHRAGILHRDFKSANVMLVPGADGDRAVIMDFGLAMELGPEPARTESSSARPGELRSHGIVGTPAYLSPEQVTQGELSPASDLYALGVVLFEMTTGRLPFERESPLEMALAHVNDTPASPHELVALESDWEQAILRLLSKDPAERYATANDVVLALEGRLNGKVAARYSIPAEQDAFVGRAAELEVLESRLEGSGGSSPARLLTLQGFGGTGKTRLALNYGWQSLDRWPGGVWFCDLTEARSVEGVVSAVAAALDIPLSNDDSAGRIGNALAGRGKLLLILDNFEQVVEYGEATLGRWLERATEVTFLATSRERLQLPGEVVHQLEPLDPLTQGTELFEVRAQNHRPGFLLDESNRGLVVETVQRLDGLPLAIELAASRLSVLSLDQLRDRLVDRLKVLTGGKRGRHATLRATLDWSWELLDPWEQAVLAQVSVFEGGFTLDAAEAVVSLGEHECDRFVLDGVQSLVGKSWVRARVVRGMPRFGMYRIVQEYAAERLREGLTEDATRAMVEVRHGLYFSNLGTEESLDSLRLHGGVLRGRSLRLELDNQVAAFRSALARSDAGTAALSYLAAAVVLRTQDARSTVEHGRNVLAVVKEGRDRARVLNEVAWSEANLGRMEDARDDYEAALAICRDVGDRKREGLVLENLGVLCREQGLMDEASQHFERALGIHRDVENRPAEGNAHGLIGNLCRQQGRMQEAREHFEVALAIHREVGNDHAEGMAVGNLGVVNHQQGRMQEALECYRAALVVHREVGNRLSEGRVLGNLGNLHQELGQNKEARECLEAALTMHREVGNLHAEAMALGNLGILHHDQGNLDEAQANYEASLRIDREAGFRVSEGIVLGNLGTLHRRRGRVNEALQHYEEALAIHREVGDHRTEGFVLGHIGTLHRLEGRMDEALECYDSALVIHRDVGDRRSEGIVVGQIGTLRHEQGRLEEARDSYQAALTIHREVDDRQGIGTVLVGMAALEMRQGNPEVARALLAEAESIAKNLDLGEDSDLALSIARARQGGGYE